MLLWAGKVFAKTAFSAQVQGERYAWRPPLLPSSTSSPGTAPTSSKPISNPALLRTANTILKEEGLLAFYNGLTASLQRQFSFAFIRVGCYEPVKQFYLNLFTGKYALTIEYTQWPTSYRATSTHSVPLPVELATSTHSVPLPVELATSTHSVPLPVELATSTHSVPLPVELATSTHSVPLPVELATSTHSVPLPVELATSTHSVPLPVELATSTHSVPLPVELATSTYSVPLPVELATSTHSVPLPVELATSTHSDPLLTKLPVLAVTHFLSDGLILVTYAKK